MAAGPERAKKRARTHVAVLALSAALVCLSLSPARAQTTLQSTWKPSGAVTLIVPFAAGGSTDVIARTVADGLRLVLGQPVLVENRAGAGGSLGTAAIAKAAPDGLTIGLGTASTLAINPAAFKSLPFDVLTDLEPIGMIAAVPNIMSVHPGVPANSAAELIALAKAKPGALSYASPGHGSVAHLLGEQFKFATGTDLLHVPYRGMGPALADAIGGQVQVIFDNLPTSLALVQDGKLRALAVSGAQRSTSLPQVPTFAEAQLDDLNWTAFFGLIGPKATPLHIVQAYNDALAHVLATSEVRSRLAAQQASVAGGTPAAFKADIARELARMRRAVAAAKIEIN